MAVLLYPPPLLPPPDLIPCFPLRRWARPFRSWLGATLRSSPWKSCEAATEPRRTLLCYALLCRAATASEGAPHIAQGPTYCRWVGGGPQAPGRCLSSAPCCAVSPRTGREMALMELESRNSCCAPTHLVPRGSEARWNTVSLKGRR